MRLIHSPIVAAILLSLATICWADTILLSPDREVHATVTRYKNNLFTILTADGRTETVSANNIRKIRFESNTPAQIVNRTRGPQEARVIAYENGGFIIEGDSRPLSLVFVEQIEFVPIRGQEIEVLTHGQQVDIQRHLALGNVTIVEFYADWCGSCKYIAPRLEQTARTDPQVALRKIDIVNWQSPVVRQYNIHSIPHIQIYGRKGELVGTVGNADLKSVEKFVAQAKKG